MSKRRHHHLTIVLYFTGLCSAQGPMPVHVSPLISFDREESYLAKELREIAASLDPGKLALPSAQEGFEAKVLAAAMQSARLTLNIEFGVLNGIRTLQTKDGDTLVARWTPASPTRRERAIWLWDTPYSTTFVLEVEPAILGRNEINNYCEQLFVWDKYPLKLTSLKLAYASEGATASLTGTGAHEETSSGSFRFWFAGILGPPNGYIAAGMSKPIFEGHYPPEAYMVPERFPPLRFRLVESSKLTLLEELGKGYKGLYVHSYPSRRDLVVLNELLSRGPLSYEEVREAVIGRFENSGPDRARVIYSRMASFIYVIERRKEFAAYASKLARLSVESKVKPILPEDAVDRLFAAMVLNRADLSDAALTLAERNQYTRLCLHHIGRISLNAEALKRLSDLKVRPEFEDEKKNAIESIVGRMKRDR